MEEELARQSAKMEIEEKKWQSAVEEKKQLEVKVAEQRKLLKQALEKLSDRMDIENNNNSQGFVTDSREYEDDKAEEEEE